MLLIKWHLNGQGKKSSTELGCGKAKILISLQLGDLRIVKKILLQIVAIAAKTFCKMISCHSLLVRGIIRSLGDCYDEDAGKTQK